LIKFYGTKSEFGFLSNFFHAPIQIDDVTAPTTEHFFQAMKTLVAEERLEILAASTPRQAKLLGSKCQLRADWEDVAGTTALQALFRDHHGELVTLVKDHLMFVALVAKFKQHEDLYHKLLLTGEDELVEASPTDYYWGAGQDGSGLNKLGRMLTLIRKVSRDRHEKSHI
jgi:hypothetical protein